MPDKTKILMTLDRLIKEPSLDYCTLMSRYKNELKWTLRFSGNNESRRKVKEIKRRAIVKSVIDISKNEPVNSWNIRFSHPAIYDAMRYIYDYGGRDSPWQMILDDAGIKISKTQREWTLKKLLERIENIGDTPSDFCHGKVYSLDSYICMKSRRLFKKFGKAVLLCGIDFNSLPKIDPKKHRFCQDDFRLVSQDFSLSEDEKSKYIFQGLSMQYYSVFESPEFLNRKFNVFDEEDDFSYKSLRENIGIGNNLENRNGNNIVVRLCYVGESNARFYSTDFSFNGVNSGLDARSFHRHLECLVDFRIGYLSGLL